ncbi:nuclear transport factor 2 family protein [Flavobacterium sp. CYK-55]|uniref:nuclear transport factor 2 family protein n=1 Tax=Flavobacterium sp. CYK-55 TaxID=2835529 RepID=UPI001BD0F6CE|nr:nuclear transport factor 2 family protein [Flavobacterium sp. CYK-55]MBS7786757.1 nuclear transport factor 2 family protein [Flavobacterium sp. CYK-55]
MSKKLIQDFYKSDALINSEIMDQYLHPEVLLDWNSSTGFKQLNREQLLSLTTEMSKAYVRSKARISHIVKEGNLVSVRYTHCIKTIENPREEMVLAHFMVIWEIKDDKLYRGFQISQLP